MRFHVILGPITWNTKEAELKELKKTSSKHQVLKLAVKYTKGKLHVSSEKTGPAGCIGDYTTQLCVWIMFLNNYKL